jgi:hypothetical protein
MEQVVQILSFGSAWWVRPGRDENDPERYTRHAAYFNSTGIAQGRKIHTAGPVHGMVRFNVRSGLDPHRTHSNLGQKFCCTRIENYRETNRLLVIQRALDTATPTHFLACMNSTLHGTISLRTNWRVGDAAIISMSRYRGRQEALVLIAAAAQIRTTVGCWTVTQSGVAVPQLVLMDAP